MREYLKHFIAIGFGTIINIFIGLITTPIITRLVNVSDYGAFAMFNTYTNMAVMVLGLGLDQSLIRFYYDSKELDYKRRLITITAGCSLVVTTIVCLVACCFVYEFRSEFFICLMVNIFVQLFFRFSQLVLRVEYKTKLYALLNSLNKIIYLILVLGMFGIVSSIDNLFLLIIATIVSTIIPVIVGVMLKKELWMPLLKSSTVNLEVKKVIKFGLPFILSLGITTLFEALDKLSINYFCDYSEVGVYSSAITIVNIFTILQTTFNTVWAPMSIEHYTKNPEDKIFFKNVNNIITILMFAFGCSLIAFKDIFILLLGKNYREGTYIIPFLIFHPIMYTISETTAIGIDFAKKSKLHIIVAITACITNAIGNFWLVPHLGGRGAAISTGVSYIVFFTTRTILGKKYFNYHPALKKIYILVGTTSFFALYSTFFKFNWTYIFLYLICMTLIVILYKNTISQILNYAKKYLHTIVKNK